MFKIYYIQEGLLRNALMEKDDDGLNKINSFKTARNQKNILHKLADIGEIERLQVMTNFLKIVYDDIHKQ